MRYAMHEFYEQDYASRHLENMCGVVAPAPAAVSGAGVVAPVPATVSGVGAVVLAIAAAADQGASHIIA